MKMTNVVVTMMMTMMMMMIQHKMLVRVAAAKLGNGFEHQRKAADSKAQRSAVGCGRVKAVAVAAECRAVVAAWRVAVGCCGAGFFASKLVVAVVVVVVVACVSAVGYRLAL
eukprot:COSAG06_NODE_7421_length_2510_cov_2.255496_3_plen_112_part_00